MRCVQVVGPDASVRLGLLEGTQVSILVRPHETIATTLGPFSPALSICGFAYYNTGARAERTGGNGSQG